MMAASPIVSGQGGGAFVLFCLVAIVLGGKKK